MSATIANATELLFQPLLPEPTGQDPRYLDDFDSIRREVDKLQGTDYGLIRRCSERLLMDTSKDMRVAGFYLLALSFEQGVDGLIAGLCVYCELLERFGLSLHPKREQAKLATVKWLNNEKIVAFIQQHSSVLTASSKSQLETLIQRLNNTIKAHFGDNGSQFFILNDWLASAVLPPEVEKPPKKLTDIFKAKPKVESNITALEIDSDKQLLEVGRKLIRFCHKSKQPDKALKLARILRWSDMVEPKDKQGKTAVPGLRKAAFDTLAASLKDASPSQLVDTCESLLMEPGAQFWLTLQYVSYQALIDSDYPHQADILLDELKQLLKRCPRLPELSFADDKPFADEDTRAWLKSIQSVPATSISPESVVSEVVTTTELLAKAKASASKDTLQQLAFVQSFTADTICQQLHVGYAVALLTKRLNKPLAQVLFAELDSELLKTQAALWQPDLAVAIWNDYYQLLRLVKPLPLDVCDRLKTQMCKANLPLALRYLS